MKTRMLLVVVTLLGVFLVKEAQAYYNPSTGRWLSRDPIGERGGKGLVVFVENSPLSGVDRHGLQCCMLNYVGEGWNHAAIECDDGTYVSGYPAGGQLIAPTKVIWRQKDEDEKEYGKPRRICFDCIKGEDVAKWLKAYKEGGGGFCGLNNNCSDIARQAINGSLSPDQQKQPTCGKCRWGFGWADYETVEDLLDPKNFSWPTKLQDQVEQWKANGCKRYRCKKVHSAGAQGW